MITFDEQIQKDFDDVVKGYRDNNIPLDMLYLDIDYMQDYKDFTTNEENFPDFKEFVDSLKAQNVHPVPIIDAGVKMEDGYDVYDEGVENGFRLLLEDKVPMLTTDYKKYNENAVNEFMALLQ